jgi:hypothetical protein
LNKAKPFSISKRLIWEAFEKVKANQGAAGVDEQSIEEFESDLRGNLYKLWNRMSSGSYMPPPVRRVEIPKSDGGKRPLGIPTVNVNYTFAQRSIGLCGNSASISSTKKPTFCGTEDATHWGN